MCSADKANWIEVRFELGAEAAEAVAELLGRFAYQGIAIEKAPPTKDSMVADRMSVRGFILADEEFPQKQTKLEEGLWHLNQILPIPAPTYQPIHDQDWMESWKQHYHPLTVGERLLIVPAWSEVVESERIPVRINPGMAFGTGTHPSTQLCLEFLEQFVTPGCQVMDIGCGSGILSIAGVGLGASKALALDIDSAALRSTQENVRLNNMQDEISIHKGSLSEILCGQFSSFTGEVVVVNILAKVLEEMLEMGLAEIVMEKGILILAGILENQAGEIINRAQKRGLQLLAIKKASDWVALAFQKK